LKEIKKDDPAGLKKLLDTDVNAELLFASHNGYLEQVKALISANVNVNANAANDTTPLIVASQAGHLEVVRALLAANADVNAERGGKTALMVAATSPFLGQLSERVKVIRALLAAGADVNARDNHGSTASRPLSTPIQRSWKYCSPRAPMLMQNWLTVSQRCGSLRRAVT
jgi:ankyrin repeat protein